MSRATQWIIAIIIIAAVAVGIGVAVSHNKNNTYSTTPSPNPPSSTQNNSNKNSATTPPSQATTSDKVSIINYAFSPSSTTVKKGTTVTWTNNDSTGHTVTSDSGNELASSTIAPGSTYTHTFNTAGTYKYHCSIHPYMTGTVTVTE